MGRRGLRYRLTVYLVVSLCMVSSTVLYSGHDMIPLLIGMYIPAVILTEFGVVRTISRHGGVEKARRDGFKERMLVNMVLVLSWIVVAMLLGRHRLIPIIIGLLLPLSVLFDLLFIYRVFSRQWNPAGPAL